MRRDAWVPARTSSVNLRGEAAHCRAPVPMRQLHVFVAHQCAAPCGLTPRRLVADATSSAARPDVPPAPIVHPRPKAPQVRRRTAPLRAPPQAPTALWTTAVPGAASRPPARTASPDGAPPRRSPRGKRLCPAERPAIRRDAAEHAVGVARPWTAATARRRRAATARCSPRPHRLAERTPAGAHRRRRPRHPPREEEFGVTLPARGVRGPVPRARPGGEVGPARGGPARCAMGRVSGQDRRRHRTGTARYW